MVTRGAVNFSSTPSIAATGVTAGPLEKKSAYQSQFDKIYDDERCNQKTNEQGHAKMMEDAIMIALGKVGKTPKDVDFLLMGDLVNQMTPSNFCAAATEIPYIGLFSACATSVSSLLLSALLTETGMANLTIAGTASQHNAVERQFRYPIEYGAQKGETAQWTATAAGAAVIIPYEKDLPAIVSGTFGKSVDMGLTDPLNMGAAMAPAAFDTLKRHLQANDSETGDYDLIMTGDLGKTGFDIFIRLCADAGFAPAEQFTDAGMEFYGHNPDFLAGASGSGCSAAVYFSEVYNKMMDGTYKRVLLLATGALLSPMSYQQGDTIPCTAHAVELQMK